MMNYRQAASAELVPFKPNPYVLYKITTTTSASKTPRAKKVELRKMANSGRVYVCLRVHRGPNKELSDKDPSIFTTRVLTLRNKVCALTSSKKSKQIKRLRSRATVWVEANINKQAETDQERRNLLFIHEQLGDFQIEKSTCAGDINFVHTTSCTHYGKLHSSHDMITTKVPSGRGDTDGAYIFCNGCDAVAFSVCPCAAQRHM